MLETALGGAGAGVFGDGGEDGDELIGLVLQGDQGGRGREFADDEEFHPVGGFVEFLDAVVDFGGESGGGAAAVGFAVVGTDGGAGAEELLAEDAGFVGFGEFAEGAEDAQGEIAGAVSEVKWRFFFVAFPSHGGWL